MKRKETTVETPKEPQPTETPPLAVVADPELAELEDPPEPPTPEPVSEKPPQEEPDTSEEEAKAAGPPTKDLDALRAAIGRQKGSPAKPQLVATGPVGAPLQTPASKGFDHSMFQDDLSDGKVRTIEDMFARYPIGDGEYSIFVDRKSPERCRGRVVAGIQKPIESQIDHEEFARQYGGGTYMLTVYGPTPGRRPDKEGNLKRKAFTKPVKVIVPDPYDQNPPNPEMAVVGDDEEEEDMPYGMRRHGATDADAQIKKAELEHEAENEERRIRREEHQRELAERRERKRIEEERQAQLQASSLVERVMENQAEELRELRNKQPNEVAALGGMAQILEAVKPKGPSETEVHRLQSEIEKERTRSGEELNRLREEHRKEVDRIRDDHVRHEREDRERAERLAKDRDEVARRQVEDARNEVTRRITELTAQYEARLNDERRQHDRDLAAAREMNNTTNATTQSSYDMRLEVKQNEINRLTAEMSQMRSELEQEKAKTLADRVGEFAGAAEALGYTKDEGGDKGWREMLGEAAVGLVQNAPALAANVAASLKGSPPQQPPMLNAPPGVGMVPPAQNYGPVFATEGVDTDLGYDNYTSPVDVEGEVIPQGADPLGDFEPQGQPDQPQQPEQPPAVADTPSETAEAAPVANSTPSVQSDPNSMNITDDQIVEFSEFFRSAFKQGASPEEFSDGVIQQLGPIMSGAIVREIPVKRVSTLLQKAPEGSKDPLLRRDGQQFLNKVWALVAQKTPSPAG